MRPVIGPRGRGGGWSGYSCSSLQVGRQNRAQEFRRAQRAGEMAAPIGRSNKRHCAVMMCVDWGSAKAFHRSRSRLDGQENRQWNGPRRRRGPNRQSTPRCARRRAGTRQLHPPAECGTAMIAARREARRRRSNFARAQCARPRQCFAARFSRAAAIRADDAKRLRRLCAADGCAARITGQAAVYACSATLTGSCVRIASTILWTAASASAARFSATVARCSMAASSVCVAASRDCRVSTSLRV